MFATSELPRLPYRQWFPWLALFRAGGLAVSWPQLGISFAAVAVFCAGTGVLGWWFPRETPSIFSTELIDVFYIDLASGDSESIRSTATAISPARPQDFNPLILLLDSWRTVASPIFGFVWYHDQRPIGGSPKPGSTFAIGLNLAFALAVWSLFGTAVCRASAVQLAKDRSESLPQAVRFAWRRWFSTTTVPLIPGGAMLAVALALAVAAWFGRLPLIGAPLLTVASPLLFLGGLTLALLALLIVCGWPLMVAAMGTEDCDGFGALSRTFSFLMGKPAHAIWNFLVSGVYGSVLVALVGGVFTLAILAESRMIEANTSTGTWGAVIEGSHATAQFLLATFGVSLFWSLAAVNYLLLRQAVDQKPFSDIAAGVDEISTRRELPVVGIPATDYRPQHSEAEAVAPAT